MRRSTLLAFALAAFALPITACDDAFGPERPVRLTVLLTDSPGDYFEEARVWISEMSIIPAGGPPISQEVESPEEGFNLLELQNGATALLGEFELPAGRFLQFRLVVERAEVTLKDPYEFTDGSQTKDLHVPSGGESGIKINLRYADGNGQRAGVHFEPGQSILVIDMDVSNNFVIQGDPHTSAGINDVLFTPLLRATVEDVAASISGTVSGPEGLDVEGLKVKAELEDSEDIEPWQTTSGSAHTDANGDYTIWFLAPGTYSVSVELPENGDYDGMSTDPDAHEVELDKGDAVTGVDFEIKED